MVQRGTYPGELSFHARSISALSFSKQRLSLASGCRDGAVIVWSLRAVMVMGECQEALLSKKVFRVVVAWMVEHWSH